MNQNQGSERLPAPFSRCCQAVRSSTSALRIRTRVRSSSMCAGGIHDSGTSPANKS
jgi:hypothetical protein